MRKEPNKKDGRFQYLNFIGIATSIFGIPAAILIVSSFAQKHSHPAPQQQQAGQAALDENYLKGGALQRSLYGNEKPQEFIQVETAPNVPQFLQKEFTVHAGKIVSVTLRNQSKVGHQDDWVLVKPGTRKQVELASRKTPLLWDWIPETDAVLAFVPMTEPGDSQVRIFRAPTQPGDYPFLCTYPGRGEAMNGILHVVS